MYIRWLLLWVAYREDNQATDVNWNNCDVWTHEEFSIFKLACRRGDIIPTSSILPPNIRAGNAPRTTAAPINRDLDDWNRGKRDAETTLDRLKQPTQWSAWLKPFILKAKQENWQRVVDRNMSNPKDASKTVLLGDDLKLWERQNNHVNVLLRKLITTSAGISILDNAGDDASNAFDDLKIYHETSDIASARSVIILDELDQL